MKIQKLMLLILLATSICYGGGLKLPSNSFEISEIDAAKEKANAKGYPIAFLYTNKESTCPLCNGASELIIKELKSSTILVYVRNKNDMPKNVAKTLSKRGKFIPKVAVYDSAIEEELGLVIYEEIKKDGGDAFDGLKKIIRAYKKRTN